MHKVRRLRAMGSMCRQQAAYNPAQGCRFIAEAEYWEKLAAFELTVLYGECNSLPSSDIPVGGSLNPNETLQETLVGATGLCEPVSGVQRVGENSESCQVKHGPHWLGTFKTAPFCPRCNAKSVRGVRLNVLTRQRLLGYFP